MPSIAAAFAAGVAVSTFFPHFSLWLGAAAALLSVAASYVIWRLKLKYRSAALLAACLLTGIMAGQRIPPQVLSGDMKEKLEEGSIVLKGSAAAPSEKTEYGVKIDVKINNIISPYGEDIGPAPSIAMPQSVRLYLSAVKEEWSIEEGDVLFLKNLRQVGSGRLRNPDVPERSSGGFPALAAHGKNVLVYDGDKSIFQRARNRLAERLTENLSAGPARFAEAVVAGRSAGIGKVTAESFRVSGLAHLLAVSGLHMSIVAMMIMKLIMFVVSRIPSIAGRVPARWVASVLSLPVLWLFAFFACARPPVIRAAIMVTACQLALMAGRKSVLPSALALAGLCIVMANPENIKSPSFLLSFSAVGGIFLFSGKIREIIIHAAGRFSGYHRKDTNVFRKLMRKAGVFFVGIISVSAAATLSTLPVTCFFFKRVPITGIVSNILAIPVFSFLVLPANFLYCGLLLCFSGVPGSVSMAVEKLNLFFLCLVHTCSLVPPLQLAAWTAAPAAVLVVVAALLIMKKRLRAGIILVAVAFFMILLPPAWIKGRRFFLTGGKMTVVFAEVGQGDGILVRTPGRKHILIDAGPPEGRGVVEFLREWTSTIDLFIITHGHRDHYGGSMALLDSDIRIKEVWVNPQGFEETLDNDYITAVEAFKKGGADIVIGPKCGTRRFGEVRLTVVSPCEPDGYDYLLDWNNNSIVVHMRYGNAGFLFTGDIEREGEEKIAQWMMEKAAAVIKVPHHGSAGASSEVITGWKGAKIGVVTAGAGNKFGFPHARVLRDFKNAGIEVLRVDRDGAWILITDGSSLSIRNYKWKQVMKLMLAPHT